jgi:hypothetical protein
MPRIDKTVDNAIEILVNEAKLQAKAKNAELKFWEGKKIVSIQKWDELKRKLDDAELFDFIPNEHIEWPIRFMDYPLMGSKKYQEWTKSWRQYLISKKDPKLGKRLCHGCILNAEPDKSIWGFRYPTSTSIRDMILKHPLAKDYKFGCPTNVFKCPYKQLDQGDELFVLAEMWEIVHGALMEAHHRTYYDHGGFFEVDFERRIAYEQRHWYKDPVIMRIDEALRTLKLSVVPISSIQDIFDVLTNPESLGLVLEQYIKQVGRGNAEYTGKPDPNADKKAQRIRKYKKPILELFTELKDKIKLGELLDLYDQPKELEAEESARRLGIDAWLLKNHPEHEKDFKKKRNGKCVDCSKFSNIHCLNCGDWVCDEHWRAHGSAKHKYENQ